MSPEPFYCNRGFNRGFVRRSRRASHATYDVRVGAKGDGEAGVPEMLLDDIRVDVFLEQDRRKDMVRSGAIALRLASPVVL